MSKLSKVSTIVDFMEQLFQTLYIQQTLILYTKPSPETDLSELADELVEKDFPLYWLVDSNRFEWAQERYRVFLMSSRTFGKLSSRDNVGSLNASVVICLDEEAAQMALGHYKNANTEKMYIFSCIR